YIETITERVGREISTGRVIQQLQHIPDEETEVYFKAADVLVLPYARVYQSGVLFLAYSFGVPVVATNVGSFSEEVQEGKTGFLCRPCDPSDMAMAIERYFASDLFKNADRRRQITDDVVRSHSWELVGRITTDIYRALLDVSAGPTGVNNT